MRRSLGLPVMFALAAVWIIWGSTYLAIKIGLETIPPFAMQGFRFAIAGALLYTFLRARGAPAPTRRQWWAAARVGSLLLIGGIGLVSVAEDWGIGTGLAATLIAIQPMMMSLAGGLLGNWPHRREWIGMGIGLVGVLVLMGDSGLSGSLGGIALVMIASVTWTAGSLVSKRIDLPKGAMASAAEMLCAAPGFAVLAALKGEELQAPSLRSATALAYLVVVGSIIAFSAYLFLLGRVRPALAVSYAYVNPIIAVALGAVFADEVISANMAIAMPLVLCGVVLVTFGARGLSTDAPETGTQRPRIAEARIAERDSLHPDSLHAVPASVD